MRDKKLADNTILIFTTDNGSGNGISKDGKIGYNKGFRGKKGSKAEGGHRVPFFIRWKDGKIKGGKDSDELTAHVDLIPTLAALCNLELPENQELDGVDFSPLLLGKSKRLADRTVFVHHRQDWRQPKDVDQTCLMSNQWRLLNGAQLYEVQSDQMQRNNIAAQHPDKVKQLLNDNLRFLERSKENPEYYELPCSVVGNPLQPEITLTIQHAIGEGKGIWKADQVSAGMKNTNNTHAIAVEKAGKYEIACCRWPKECPGPILGIPEKNPKEMYTYKAIKPEKVRISIANQMLEKTIGPQDQSITFTVKLSAGKTMLVNDFVEGNETYGVYYTYIKYLGDK